MSNLKQAITEPLLYFLLVGFAIYYFNDSAQEESRQEDVIVVDDAALVTYIQYRLKMFNPELAADNFRQMSEHEQQQLVKRYTREEALYREALKLGLDKNDYLIKQRLIQKMEFLSESVSENGAVLDEQKLQAYYKAHLSDYRQAATISFRHLYFSGEKAAERAEKSVDRLNSTEQGGATVIVNTGERFPYGSQFANRTLGDISAKFGDGFSNALWQRQPSHVWSKPLQSDHGWHTVLITHKAETHAPSLNEIRDLVVSDFKKYTLSNTNDAAVSEIINSYKVQFAVTTL